MRPGNPKIAGALYRPLELRRAAPQRQRTISLLPIKLKIQSRDNSRGGKTFSRKDAKAAQRRKKNPWETRQRFAPLRTFAPLREKIFGKFTSVDCHLP